MAIIQQLVEFTWNAMAGGVCYDLIKQPLGSAFDLLAVHKKNNEKEQFENILTDILAENQQMTQSLIKLNKAYGKNVFEVTTGDISANGAVIIGSNNKIG